MREVPFEEAQPPSRRFQARLFTMTVKVSFSVKAGFIDSGQ